MPDARHTSLTNLSFSWKIGPGANLGTGKREPQRVTPRRAVVVALLT